MNPVFQSMLIGGFTAGVVTWWAIWFYEHPKLVRRILWGVQKDEQ